MIWPVAVSRQPLAFSTRFRRDYIPRKRGKIQENATHFCWRQQPPLREIWGNQRGKLQVFAQKNCIACSLAGKLPCRKNLQPIKYFKRQTPRSDKKSVRGVHIFIQQNPVNRQNIIHSQGSFYYNVKMIKRSFCFHFVGAVVAASKNAQHFPIFFRVYAGYNRGKAA